MTEQEFGFDAIDDIIRDSVTGREHHSVRWESFTDQFIDAIKTAKVYVDCGAEYGFYVRLALKYGPKDLQIFAFEPEQIRYDLLERSLRGHDRVKVYPYAVSSCAGTVTAVKPDVGVSLSIDGFHTVGTLANVNCVALDDIVQDVRVDVLKMDIEGAEDLAFIGMSRVLARRPTIFIEWHPVDAEIRRHTTDLLVTAGYSIDEPMSSGRVVLS